MPTIDRAAVQASVQAVGREIRDVSALLAADPVDPEDALVRGEIMELAEELRAALVRLEALAASAPADY